MKKTTALLAIVMMLAMLVSVVPVGAYSTIGETIADYDDYGYYVYYDFENMGGLGHLNYFGKSGSKTADNLLCNPFGFAEQGSGHNDGTAEVLEDEDGNKYVRYTTKGSRDYNALAVFRMQGADGKSYVLGQATEASFRFRVGEITDENITDDDRISLVITRRGTKKGNTASVTADKYGNIYAYVNGNMEMVFKNADGKTLGGDGEFMNITYRWYDVTNTYSLYIDGEPIVEAMPLLYNYRGTEFVTNRFDDNFALVDRVVVGSTGNPDANGAANEDRTLEILRYDTFDKNTGDAFKGYKFIYDVDDVKLSRVESSQGGAVYYDNSFDADHEGFSLISSRSNVYMYAGSGASTSTINRSEADSDFNRYLNLSAGQYFSLNDKDYQQFLQGNTVFEFSVKGTPTQFDGLKAILRLNDAKCMNMSKILLFDSDGALYTDSGTRIDGYKISEDEWLNIAIVVMKNHMNDGKFCTFSASSSKSSNNNPYFYAFYIDGNFVGISSHTMDKWNGLAYSKEKYTTSGYHYSITDYTVGGDVAALDLSSLTLVNASPAENHKIYKTANGKTYYDITFDANGAQVKYSAMVLSDTPKTDDENLRIFTDGCINAKLDNIRIYEGSAPDSVYAAANSDKGGKVLNIDFANANFPGGNITARDNEAGTNVLGAVINWAVLGSDIVHKTADGETVTKANTLSSEYATLTFKPNSWLDYFVPIPKAVNGVLDFDYSFDFTVRNITFTSEANPTAPNWVNFLSHRFEVDGKPSTAGTTLAVDSNGFIYGGKESFKLYNADGTLAKFDNTQWNNFRCDLSFYKDSSRSEITLSYYLNGELLYLEDGTPAANVTNSVINSNMLQYLGTTNYRLRLSQMGNNTVSMDIKNLSVNALAKPVYTEIDADGAAINDNVTIINATLPKYSSDKYSATYDALSIVKKVSGAEQSMPLIRVDSMSGKAYICMAGQNYELLNSEGTPFTVGADGLPVTVVYNDIDGMARYYVNGSVAYIDLSGEITPAVDLTVSNYDFTQLNPVSSAKLAVFAGYADESALLGEDDYKITLEGIKKGDTAELIGFQVNPAADGIRIIAGVDNLYYSKVGFELETFIGGESMGKKDIYDNSVFGSIVANGATVTAGEMGYKYLAAGIINDLPESFDEETYILIRSYTEICGFKHYDTATRLVVTDDGYYFLNNGVLYENSFGGITAPPSTFTKKGDSTSTVSATANGAIAINSTASVLTNYYLNQYVGNDYLVQSEFTYVDGDTARYFGLLMRYQNEGSFIIAAFRANGDGWIQAKTADGTWLTLASFNLNDLGIKIEKNKTYILSGVCTGDYVALFIDGTLVAEGTIPAGYEKGMPGVATSGISIEVDDFIVRQPEKVTAQKVIFSESFDGLTALPATWKTDKLGEADMSVSVSGGKVTIAETTGNARGFLYLDRDFGTDYAVEADITIEEMTTGRKELALVYAFESANNFSYAYSMGGGYSKCQSYNGTKWINTSASSEYKLERNAGDTFKIKAVCSGGNKIEIYLDGSLVASGIFSTPYPAGKIGFVVDGVKLSVDNVQVSGETTEYAKDYVLYEQNFDGLTSVPAEWARHDVSCRTVTDDFALSVVDGKLVASDVTSALTVVALNKDIDYGDSFVYEATFSMDREAGKYMGPVFGIQADGRCAMYTFKVPDASWNLEAWYKDKPVDPVINASWVNYGKGDFGSTAKDTEYRVKLVYNKGNVVVYVDGVKITEGKITDEKLFDGKLGFVFRDSVITVDDVRITKPIKIFDISDENSAAIKFRVATFNLGDFSTANGSSGDGIPKGNGTEVTKEEYRAVFERVGADVWGLQEDSQYFNGTTKESPFDAIYSTVHTNYERNFTGAYNGKAFLTSYDVYDVTPVYYTPIKTSYSGDSTVGYSHPWFLAGKVNVQGKEVTFITLHLEWRCKEQRFQQIKEILAYAKEQEYCIILGDFNPENYVNGEKVTDPNDIHNVNPGNVNMYQVDWKKFTDEGFEPANGGRFGVYGTLMSKGVAKNPLPWDNVFVSSNIKIKAAECVTEPWMNDHAIFVADLELH